MVKYGQYVVPSHNEMVNFGVGQPSTDMLPLEMIKRAMKDNMKISDPSLLQYGDIPGYLEFRESFKPRRGRINCSLNDNGKWRWFGTQFIIMNN